MEGINGIEKEDPDFLEFLFDIVVQDDRLVSWDFMTIVCNLYVGARKVATETDFIDKDSFCLRDSRYIGFEKKNISGKATKIVVLCRM